MKYKMKSGSIKHGNKKYVVGDEVNESELKDLPSRLHKHFDPVKPHTPNMEIQKKNSDKDPWKEVTEKTIDAYAEKCKIVFDTKAKGKKAKVAALEAQSITPEMVADNIPPAGAATEEESESGGDQ